jgi:hypothetical protein
MNLLAELARLLRRADPVPPAVVEAAEAAGALIALDWLELLADTVPLLRSTGARRLTFGPDPLVHLEIRRTGPTVDIVGLGPAHARLDLHSPETTTAVDLDEAGYFQCLALPAGRLRLVLTEPGQAPRPSRWFHP